MTKLHFFAGGNVQVVEIWAEDHGSWLQALHLIFGMGTLTAPLIAEPFLAKELQHGQVKYIIFDLRMLVAPLFI